MPSSKSRPKVPKRPAGLVITPPAPRPESDNPGAQLFREAREQMARASDAVSRPVAESLPDSASHPRPAPLAFPAESHPEPARLPEPEAPAENLAALALSLPYRKGNLRINLDYLDNVVGKLSRNARLLYIYLLRYRDRGAEYTVRLNWPTLEKKTDLSRTTLHKATRELEAAGLAFVEDHKFGKGREQGFRFRLSHTASHTVDGSLPDAESHPVPGDINRKELIAKPKRDFSNCPTCQGRGYWYPDGYEKGVARCTHARLTGEGKGGS